MYTSSEAVSLSATVLEEVVMTTMHSQQFVEILEIFCPELASLLYQSTSLVIAFLHHLSSREYQGVNQQPQDKYSTLSTSIRNLYMPNPWTLRN